MTTDTRPAGPPPIDLARLDDKQLKRRIELNRDARFGLEQATPQMLNIVFILCRRWQLDPVTDITLFEGHPWVTLDGWCRVIRRHPEWTTLHQFPVSKDDKVAWGYEADDIVVATVLGTKSHGEITGYGKVTRAEVDVARSRAQQSGKKAAPVGVHPVEMATKRSLARAARLALGLDIPDETVVEQEITEEIAQRNAPEKVARDAAEYSRVFGANEDDVDRRQLPTASEVVNVAERSAQLEAQLQEVADSDEGDEVSDYDVALSHAWQRNRALADMATQLRLKPATLSGRATLVEIDAANAAIEADIVAARKTPA